MSVRPAAEAQPIHVDCRTHPRRGPVGHRGSRFAAARRRGPPPHDTGTRQPAEPPLPRVQAAGTCRSATSGPAVVERVTVVRGGRLRSAADETLLRVRLLGAPRSGQRFESTPPAHQHRLTEPLLVAVDRPARRVAGLRAGARRHFEARAQALLADELRAFGDSLGRLSANEHALGRAFKPLTAVGQLSKRMQAISRWQSGLSEERLSERRQVAVPV